MINFSSLRFASETTTGTGQIRDKYPHDPTKPGGVNTGSSKFSGLDSFVRSNVQFGNNWFAPSTEEAEGEQGKQETGANTTPQGDAPPSETWIG